MSYWKPTKKEDLSISLDGKELDIYIEQDESGSVYQTIELSDLFEVIAEHIEKTTKDLFHKEAMEQFYRDHPEKRPK